MPLKELGGGNYDLSDVFRVTSASSPESAAYFIQRIPVPKIDRDAKGDATLHGAFDLGEGKYRVSWLMGARRRGPVLRFQLGNGSGAAAARQANAPGHSAGPGAGG